MNASFDICIIGAGIAGASLAAMIGSEASVLLLEAESQPGYHTTGRSAAFWSETYGGPLIQPLTTAAGTWLSAPPALFGGTNFLGPRGCIIVGETENMHLLKDMQHEFAGSPVPIHHLDNSELHARMPFLGEQWEAGLDEPTCKDIHVAQLHQACLKASRNQGVELVTGARVSAIEKVSNDWQICAGSNQYTAQILVNASGAWADEIDLLADVKPIGIHPMRRTMVQAVLQEPIADNLPLLMAIDGSFYVKPEAGGRIWLSPHDETPSPACDTAPEELDIAIAIDRLHNATQLRVKQVEHSWAGLRNFANDRLPVIGFVRGRSDYFHFTGQGGWGIQTAPATAAIAAHMLTGQKIPHLFAAIDPAPYNAARFGL